jgi:hypothetical protein
MDLLAVAPLRASLPGASGPAQTTAWDRLSRDAGVTHGLDRWDGGLRAYIAEQDAEIAAYDEGEGRRRRAEIARDQAEALRTAIAGLAEHLEPLAAEMPAAAFIERFRVAVTAYLKPDGPALEGVLREIDQLGTVATIGGSFTLAKFARALRVNLELAMTPRERRFGDGVFVAGFRLAAGLQFRRVIVCGAHEGGFPPGPGADALIEDRVWSRLRDQFPYVEDADLRSRRAGGAAHRAVASAGGGELTWCAPLYEPGGTREYYPAPMMVDAARRHDASVTTASELRRRGGAPWLRRGASPLAMQLVGPPLDAAELHLRDAIALRKEHRALGERHALWKPVQMTLARRSDRFTEWDGNVAALHDDAWLQLQSAVSPTSLEHYSACGFRYLCKTLLHLNVVDEPEGRETMEASERGTLIHGVLDAFFKEQQAIGRPAVNEAWTAADAGRLLEIADAALDDAQRRGIAGLAIYASHERRAIRADLAMFLEEDTAFRRETGAVPSAFEAMIPETEIAGVRLRGKVDRIDRTPDGRCAWVIDYKSGSLWGFDEIKPADPFAGGKKLQLPVYLAAAGDATETQALYWFMTQKGGFARIAYAPTPESQTAFSRTLEAIVSGVRAGAFPAVPGEADEFYGGFTNCKYCDYNRICSRRRDDAFTEKSGDAAISPWLHVAEAAIVAEPAR